jgi:hypothetical protein
VKKTILAAALLGMLTAMVGCGGYEGDSPETTITEAPLYYPPGPPGQPPRDLACRSQICKCGPWGLAGITWRLPAAPPRNCSQACTLYYNAAAGAQAVAYPVTVCP